MLKQANASLLHHAEGRDERHGKWASKDCSRLDTAIYIASSDGNIYVSRTAHGKDLSLHFSLMFITVFPANRHIENAPLPLYIRRYPWLA